jgi:hypothetical protein
MWHPWLANIEVRLGLWVRVIHRMVLWTGVIHKSRSTLAIIGWPREDLIHDRPDAF